jgi:hypothetical protein
MTASVLLFLLLLYIIKTNATFNCSVGCTGTNCTAFDYISDDKYVIVCMRHITISKPIPIILEWVFVNQLLNFKDMHNQYLPSTVRDTLYDSCSCNNSHFGGFEKDLDYSAVAEMFMKPYHYLIYFKEMEIDSWRNSFLFGMPVIILIFALYIHS